MFTLWFRDKAGVYTQVPMPENSSARLHQAFEDPFRQIDFDDITLDLWNGDGAWDEILSKDNLSPADRYPSLYGFRVDQDGEPLWEGDLDYETVDLNSDKSKATVHVQDALKRCAMQNAEALKRDYSGLAIVACTKGSRVLKVNSILDATGYPIVHDDEITLGHYKPTYNQGQKLFQQTLVVQSVDPDTNEITFKRKLEAHYIPGDIIFLAKPWLRGLTAGVLAGLLLDLVPGFDDEQHRVIHYTATHNDDVVDMADFTGCHVGKALEKLAYWVNAQPYSRLGVAYFVGREDHEDPGPVKAIDALVNDAAVRPVSDRRYDQVIVKGRDKRYAKRGIAPFGGRTFDIELPFSRDHNKLQAVCDRVWAYFGPNRGGVPKAIIADDDTPWHLKQRVTYQGVEYKVVGLSRPLNEGAEIEMVLEETEGGEVPVSATEVDDELDDLDPPEPLHFILTKDYSETFEELYPKEKYKRAIYIKEQIGDIDGDPIYADILYRLYEFSWEYPYEELVSHVWRFEITVWPDGKDRDKPDLRLACLPELQANGRYYHKHYLRAGKSLTEGGIFNGLWWADVLARMDNLKEGVASDPNNSTAEDDVLGTPQIYAANIEAKVNLHADTRPVQGASSHYYAADVTASLWMDARPEGTQQAHRYGASATAGLWATISTRPIVPDKGHYYRMDIGAWLAMDARPEGTRQAQRYSMTGQFSLYAASSPRPYVPDKGHYYRMDIGAWLAMDARPEGTRQAQRYSLQATASLSAVGNADYGNPATGTWAIALASAVDDAPGTRAKECDFSVTVALNPAAALNCSHIVFHATRKGAALPPRRVDVDSSATSATAVWRRCAAAGDDLAVTRIALWQKHKRRLVPAGSLPSAIKAGSGDYGASGLPAVPPDADQMAEPHTSWYFNLVNDSGGPHSFTMQLSWGNLSASVKERLWHAVFEVYGPSGWKRQPNVDLRKLILAGQSNVEIKVHVTKRLDSGSGYYPNVRMMLEDVHGQTCLNWAYLDGSGTEMADFIQPSPLQFYQTDNGYLQTNLLETTDGATLFQAFGAWLVATAAKIYSSSWGNWDRPPVFRMQSSNANVVLYSTLLDPLPPGVPGDQIFSGRVVRDGTGRRFVAKVDHIKDSVNCPLPTTATDNTWWHYWTTSTTAYFLDWHEYRATYPWCQKPEWRDGMLFPVLNVDGSVPGMCRLACFYQARTGSGLATNKLAFFNAGTVTNNGSEGEDPPNQATSTEPVIPAGGGCFAPFVYVMATTGERIAIEDIECSPAAQDFVKGVHEASGALIDTLVLRKMVGSQEEAMVGINGVVSSPDHLWYLGHRREAGRNSKVAAARLDSSMPLWGLRGGAYCPIPASDPIVVGYYLPYNLNTECGNFLVSPDGETWFLVHNAKATGV